MIQGTGSTTHPDKSRSHNSLGLAFLLFFFVLLMVILYGCSKEQPPVEKPKVPEPVVEKQPPASFIICIDNSKSIRPQERILIREIAMLLADLAEAGDRISVVTFGKGARLAASSHIRGDQDRRAFKEQVRQDVNFNENFSDIRAGIRFLAESPDSPLRHEEGIPNVIILSDGKLEPADRRPGQAFEEMNQILAEQLAGINIYAVVLGNTYCNHPISERTLPGLTGKRLMRDHIAKSLDRFFHAESLDQLLEIAVNILSRAKGITSLGEKKETNKFKIDSSVESMTLIVRKRSTDGSILCTSADIILKKPEKGTSKKAESIYMSSDYRYFDLIVIRNPREGLWSIDLASGRQPEVLSKIVSPLELKFTPRDKYYLNESATVTARIFNKKTSQISKAPFIIKGRLAVDGNLDRSNIYIDFHPDSNTGQYYLQVPKEILRKLSSEGKPITVTMEVTAQRPRPDDSKKVDPWFIRRLGPVTIKFVEPFIEWSIQEPRLFKIPLIGRLLEGVFKVPIVDKGVYFGAVLDPEHDRYPHFEGLPRLKFMLELFDDESESYRSLTEKMLDGTDEKGRIIYRTKDSFQGPGQYRYAYALEGVIKEGGSFIIRSPEYYFEIRSCVLEFWVGLAILVLFVFCFFYRLTAKLKGSISIKEYEKGRLVSSDQDEYLGRKAYKSDLFSLKAKRGCLIRKKIILTVKGGLTLVVDGQTIQKKRERLYPGDHKIVITENVREVIIDADLYI